MFLCGVLTLCGGVVCGVEHGAGEQRCLGRIARPETKELPLKNEAYMKMGGKRLYII